MDNRNTEKIPVSVVFSVQHSGEEMPVLVCSISALNVGRCYLRARIRVCSRSNAEHLLKPEDLAKQSVLMMRTSSFGSTSNIRTGTQYPSTGTHVPELLRGAMPVKDRPDYFRSVQGVKGEYSRFVTSRV